MTFTFLGAYDPDYPRNAVIRKGLRKIGAPAAECRADRHLKFWARYPILLLRLLGAPKGGRLAGGPPDARNAGATGSREPRSARRAKRGGDELKRATGGPGPRGPRCLFVPEFGQKDVPLARFWATLAACKVVFDPLAARYETKVADWRRLAPDSPAAWWNFQIDRAAFAGADLVLADTAAHKAYYCETYGLDPDKVAILPLGYDDDIFRPALPRPFSPAPEPSTPRGAGAVLDGAGAASAPAAAGRPFEVLFTGSFLPLHGTDVIVEAARIVAARDPGVRFTLAGTGRTLDAARRAAAGLPNVIFAGWRPFSELPASIAAADVCLGIFGRTGKARRVVPHKLVQAMGMGRAVVTARTPAAEEFFTHRENVVFCDEPLAESLAAAVLELKADASLRERVARAGCALVRARFSPEATARRLMEIVERRFGKRCHPERSAEKGDTEPRHRSSDGEQAFCVPFFKRSEGSPLPLSLPPYKGLIARAYALPEILAALASPSALASAPGAEILLDGRNTVTAVKIALGSGRPPAELVLKSFGVRGLKRLKTLVQASKAQRAWRGAVALAASGFGTAEPVAYLERRERGLVRESWFAAERLDGGREIRALFRVLPPARLEPLVSALAAELARLHAAGLVHRDLSDGNVLVFGADVPAEAPAGATAVASVPADVRAGTPQASPSTAPFNFAFLDTNRVRRHRRLSRFARARNLVRLGVPPGLRPYFLERYAAAAGRPLEPGFALFYRIAKGSFAGWIAVRKKLKLKALARKLRFQ